VGGFREAGKLRDSTNAAGANPWRSSERAAERIQLLS
jgi:hypothetical protein